MTEIFLGIIVLGAAIAGLVWLLRRKDKTPARAGTGAGKRAPEEVGFADLVEGGELRRGIEKMGWREPRSIQARAIDAMRSGRDLVVSAPEGSGKTGAYVIPALDRQLHREGLHTWW
jgi:superfamily II DNA/RNA helicase